MKKTIIITLCLFIWSCGYFQENLAKQRAARINKFNNECTSLGLKPDSVQHNVCVDRKKDIYNAREQAYDKLMMQCIVDGGRWLGYKCDISK